MKKAILLFGFLLISYIGFNQLIYSKVKIYASNEQLTAIGNLGVTIDHGQHKSNEWFITDLSTLDIQKLEEFDIPFEILITDMASYYAAHSADANLRGDRVDCPTLSGSSAPDITVPEHFTLGSMGGYYTYEEFLAELDQMRAVYPALITEKAAISDFETWEGRPIYWVKISDNTEVDEEEHEVLYTALHHAREPMGLSQTIFYMWYLLENYGTNDEITYLVDHTELFFVPMVNPDGYKHNQTTNPGGGGMHRKNRNPSIGTTNKGVDLNRNYSYHWNETGTSPDENDDTYAGEFAFSEPETQAIKWFCENHNFEYAFNAHSYGDLLLFPIGWTSGEFAADHDYFQHYSSHMALYNNYTAQKSSALYSAAGDSDDWMYITPSTNIFAMTPEIGDQFWPSSSTIIPTCKEMFWSNLVLSHMPHVYGVTTDLESSHVETPTGYFNYQLERLGLEDGDLTISMTPLAGIASFGSANVHSLTLSEIVVDSISYDLVPGIAFGDEIKFVLHTANGLWTKHDTLIKYYGIGTALFSDDCTDLMIWVGSWDLTDETAYSPTTCITDSPYDATYGNNVNKRITLDRTLSFAHATYAYATFNAKWEIENDYDFVEFMISTNGGTSWVPLCGKYTNPGVADQDLGEPLYDGFQAEWVLEEIDLSDYLEETNVKFSFRLITDGGLQMDGFYFDDFTLYTDAVADAGVEELSEADFRIYPNPANLKLDIWINPSANLSTIQVYNHVGQTVKTVSGTTTSINLDGLSEGTYYIQFLTTDGKSISKRFTLMR